MLGAPAWLEPPWGSAGVWAECGGGAAGRGSGPEGPAPPGRVSRGNAWVGAAPVQPEGQHLPRQGCVAAGRRGRAEAGGSDPPGSSWAWARLGPFGCGQGAPGRSRGDLARVDRAVLWGGSRETAAGLRQERSGWRADVARVGFLRGVVAPAGHEKQDWGRMEPGQLWTRPAFLFPGPLPAPSCRPQARPRLFRLVLLPECRPGRPASQPGRPGLTFLTLPLVVSRLLFWKLTHRGKVLWEAWGQRCGGRGKRTGLHGRSSKG